jgi:hypothetical protein
MKIFIFKLLLTTVPTLSNHSALGVDTLASLSEILSLIGTNHCTKLVIHRSKDEHRSMSLFNLLVPINLICKVACYISCNKTKLYCMLFVCCLPVFFQIFPAQETVQRDHISHCTPILNLPDRWIPTGVSILIPKPNEWFIIPLHTNHTSAV